MRRFEYRVYPFGYQIPEVTPKTLAHIKRGTKVVAAEDILSRKEVIVTKGTVGTIESRGPLALNVKFVNHPHQILCLWDMVAQMDNPVQPTLFDWDEQ